MNKFLTVTLTILLGACATMGGATQRADREGDIPRRFRGIYDDLSGRLETFKRQLDGMSDSSRRAVVFGGEVLPANSHRGKGLLTDSAFKGSLLWAERLKALGAGGVSIQMAYPLLNADFPDSERYWDFYKRLASGLRERGLKLHVKSGPIFTEKEFSNVDTDYRDVTADTYFRDRQRIAQRIAAEVRPDYLSIGNEPSSEMMILKIKLTPDRYIRFINETLEGMKRSGVLVGAGSGNWDSTEYITRFARDTSLDFVDLHIYPMGSPRDDFMKRAADMADIALRHRKRLIIGETWLYKASPREMTANPTLANIFARDAFAFWAPLDSRFLELIDEFADKKGIEYVSPFWTKYLFAYLDQGEVPFLAGPRRTNAAMDQKVVKQLVAGQVSPTGEAYRRIAR